MKTEYIIIVSQNEEKIAKLHQINP